MALAAIRSMVMLDALCVVVVGVVVMVVTMVTLVRIPTIKAREEHGQCDEM